MWYNTVEPDEPLENARLEKDILASRYPIVIISGPSWCGKSSFLKGLKKYGAQILSMSEVLDNLIALLEADSDVSFTDVMDERLQDSRIICIDDADLTLWGKVYTQRKLAEWIRHLSATRKVILSGIDVSERCSELLACIPSEKTVYYRYAK